MDDTISRQAAIDALDEIRHALWEIDIPSPTVPEYIEHHEQIQSVWKLLDKKQKELYVLPSAQPKQPEQQWIPCSERLPEHAGVYLVTTIVAVDKYVITSWYSTKGGWICEDRPEAWMPLPEPYKGVE